MPINKSLPPSVLAALGLAMSGCPGVFTSPCLNIATTDVSPTGPTGDTGTVTACLDYATTTGKTGDSGSKGAADRGVVPDPESVERLKGVLPDDVLERILARESSD